MLTLLTFSPLLGLIAILIAPKKSARWIALATTFIPLAIATKFFFEFDRTTSHIQFAERTPWIPFFHIDYYLGLDGLSLPMVLLTTLLSTICIIASWDTKSSTKGYFSLFLLLETGMLGVFCALDFFLFFMFWEAMLLPMYFLIGIWGGKDRVYAAIKFFLYTLFGSVLMLLVMLGMYWASGKVPTFDLIELATLHPFGGQTLSLFGADYAMDRLFWLVLFIGFAVKVPIWPFHTWLPWAHVEAPTAVSVILAGVLLKMGAYGLLRINFAILPDATLWAARALAILGVVNILYGGFCALAQTDLKKLVAYSSVSHMGFVILGMASLTPAGISGAVLQMFNHGICTAMLFLLVGVLYDRVHHRWIVKPDGTPGFGGLASVTPRLATFAALAVFASLGLPGLNGFISEVLILLGAFSAIGFQSYVIVASGGIVLGAAYLLYMYMRVFLGPLNSQLSQFSDVSVREIVTLVPLALLIVALGLFPGPLLNLSSVSVTNLISFFRLAE